MKTTDFEMKEWGNSYGAIIPKAYLNMMNFTKDKPLQISFDPNNFKIVIEEKKPKYHFTLKELMKDYDPKTRHELVDWGPDVGKEIIEY